MNEIKRVRLTVDLRDPKFLEHLEKGRKRMECDMSEFVRYHLKKSTGYEPKVK